jgi:molybdopterin-guanine dinucleotide biosynthesis protein A
LIGALLAGGVSRRLGQAKCLLDFGGLPLGLHLVRRMELFCDEVIVLSNDPASCAGWGRRCVGDVYHGAGPLGGLHAALQAASGENVFLLACDMPFFRPGLGAMMRDLMADGGFDAVIPRRGQYLEPLCAAYSPAMLPAVEAQLQACGQLRMISVLPGFRVRYVDEPERRAYGPDDLVFMNINTPEDLVAARALWTPAGR